MKVSKRFSEVSAQLLEQVEEQLNPQDPTALPRYAADIRQSVGEWLPMLAADPVFGAIALHDQLRFADKAYFEQIVETEKPLPPWTTMKQRVSVKEGALGFVSRLEMLGDDVARTVIVLCFIYSNRADAKIETTIEAAGDLYTDIAAAEAERDTTGADDE